MNTHSLSKKPPRVGLMMLGDGLQLLGIILLLYVGGLYANAAYGRYAARGDSPVEAPQAISLPAEEVPPVFVAPLPSAPTVPTVSSSITPADALSAAEAPAAGQAISEPQQVLPAIPDEPSVTRVIIPGIDVDSKVVPVGWEVIEQDGQQVAVWQVAEYAVGQHNNSVNPGAGGNIVLAGHVGGFGRVFENLYYLEPGDTITLFSAGQQYEYVVSEHLLVREEGVSLEQRLENARYIGPSDSEVLTLITCWPASGPEKFVYRVVIRAVPVQQETDAPLDNGLQP